MAHVFVSYVRENREEVDLLCEELTKHGVNVWLDRNDIMPGTRWKQGIRRAIREGSFFTACFSKEYNKRDKTYMNEELTIAIEELRERPRDRAWFIPVKLSDCEIPDWDIGTGEILQDLHYVELYKNWNAGIERILRSMEKSEAPAMRNIASGTREDAGRLREEIDLVEYLYIDERRLESYFEQIHPNRLLPTPAHEKISELLKFLRRRENGLLYTRPSSSDDTPKPKGIIFVYEENFAATRYFIPPRPDLVPRFKGLTIWVSKAPNGTSANYGVPAGMLCLIEDCNKDDEISRFSISGYTILTALIVSLYERFAQTILPENLPSGKIDFYWQSKSPYPRAFVEDPVATLKSLGCRLEIERNITSLYQVRSFGPEESDGRRTTSTIGYPIFISTGGE